MTDRKKHYLELIGMEVRFLRFSYPPTSRTLFFLPFCDCFMTSHMPPTRRAVPVHRIHTRLADNCMAMPHADLHSRIWMYLLGNRQSPDVGVCFGQRSCKGAPQTRFRVANDV